MSDFACLPMSPWSIKCTVCIAHCAQNKCAGNLTRSCFPKSSLFPTQPYILLCCLPWKLKPLFNTKIFYINTQWYFPLLERAMIEQHDNIQKISGRVFWDGANLGESIQGTGDLRGRWSSGWVGRSPLVWRNTWTDVDHTKWKRLEDTSSSPVWSMQMESSFPLLHHRMSSCQRACRLVGSATSEAISWRRAQSRQSLQTLSNPSLRPSSCRRISQVIAGSSCTK